MAVKDHSLDDRIVEAAMAEFLEHGFRSASLHKIADRAGITTGALYTRYRNKDALFISLVEPVLLEMGERFRPIQELYVEAGKTRTADALLKAIQQEEQIYLDLLFRHYDACVLFFCKSGGSTLEKQIDSLTREKADQTVRFFKSISAREIDWDGIPLIMSQQFSYYRQILQMGFSREKALSCMQTLEIFLEAGWRALFDTVL